MDGFEDAYRGHYPSVEAYTEQLVDDLGIQRDLDEVVPEPLQPYVRVDLAALARDMQIGGDLHALPAEDGGVWIFDQ
jgi:antirestriction protein